MAGTPNADLQALLDDFAKDVGGTSSAYYQDVFNAIVNSPALLSQMNAAATAGAQNLAGALDGFFQSTNPASSEIGFDPFFHLMDLPSSLMTTIANNHYTPQQISNMFTEILGHEISHASWNETTGAQIAATMANATNAISSWNKANGPQDLTSYVQDMVNAHLADEANAAMQGWNDTVSAATAAQNGAPLSSSQLANLISNTPYAEQLFDVSATRSTGTATPLAGVTMQGTSGLVNATSANVAAVSQIMGKSSPSGVPSDTYYQYYASSAISKLAAVEKGNPFQVDYSQLQLTQRPQGQAGGPLSSHEVNDRLIAAGAAKGGMGVGPTGSATIINKADGSSNRFLQGPNGTSSNEAGPSDPSLPDNMGNPTPAPDVSGTLAPGAWETATNTPTSGDAFSEIFGSGGTLPASDQADPVTIFAGVDATVLGDHDGVFLNAGASVTVQGSDDWLHMADGTTAHVTGVDEHFVLGAGCTVTLGANTVVLDIQALNDIINATGTSDTITVNGSNNTVALAGGGVATVNGSINQFNFTASGASATFNGSGEIIVAAGNTIAFGANGTGTITGNNNAVNMAATVAVTLNGTGETASGSSDFITLGNNSSMTLTGTSNSVTLGTADTVTLGASSSATITGIGGTVQATGASDTITVNGSGNTITKAGGGAATVNGGNNHFAFTATGASATLNGGGQVVTAAGDALTFGANSTGTLTGNSNTVNLGATVAVTLTGTGETVSGSSAFLTLGASSSATLTGGSNSVALGNNSSITVNGTSNTVTLGTTDTVTLGANSSAAITGNGGTVQATAAADTTTVNGSSNTITEAAGGSVTVNGGNNNLTVTATGSSASLTGAGEVITATSDTLTLGASSTATLTGNSNTLSLGASTVLTANGTGETINATSDVITVGASGSATIAGNSNTINTNTSAAATVNGNSNTVTLGTTSTLSLGASSNHNHITSASDTIMFGNSARGTVAGTSNTVNLGTSNKIYVNGSSNTMHVQTGDVVFLASNISVSILGNGATIVGNTGDIISLTGTSDNIYTDSSNIQITGTNTGDIVHGTGNTGNTTNWGGNVVQSGAYGGYSGGGYYSASGHAARQTSRAGLADIGAIGASDEKAILHSKTAPAASSAASRPASMSSPMHAADQLIHAMAAWAPASAASLDMASHGMADSELMHALAKPPAIENMRAHTHAV